MLEPTIDGDLIDIRARPLPPLTRSPSPRWRGKLKPDGVALLEVLVAILIFSIGILAVLGLQAVSISNSVQAKYRTDASFLASQIVGQMWVDRSNLASYNGTYGPKTAWQAQVAGTLPNGNGTVAVNGDTVTVTVTWQAPGDDQHNFVTVAQVNNS